jgi:hypothetical protein
MDVLREAITKDECFQLIGADAALILRNGLKDKALGRTTLASAAGVVLTASPLLVQYDMTGLAGKDAVTLRHAFSCAMHTWLKATEGRIIVREHGNLQPNIRVRIFDEKGRGAPRGIAHTKYGRKISLGSCGTISLSVDSDVMISRQFVEQHRGMPSRLVRVCLHELGHVAGLNDGPVGGVMSQAFHPREEVPSETELLAIKVIAGAAAYLQHHEGEGPQIVGHWPCRGFMVEAPREIPHVPLGK